MFYKIFDGIISFFLAIILIFLIIILAIQLCIHKKLYDITQNFCYYEQSDTSSNNDCMFDKDYKCIDLDEPVQVILYK